MALPRSHDPGRDGGSAATESWDGRDSEVWLISKLSVSTKAERDASLHFFYLLHKKALGGEAIGEVVAGVHAFGLGRCGGLGD